MSQLNVDTINEQTSSNGITIDGLTIKDSTITSGYPLAVADMWRLTSDITGTDGTISSNLERCSTATGLGSIGSAMSVSSGIWTFPQTGIYWVRMNAYMLSQSDTYTQIEIEITENNSDYTLTALNGDGDAGAGGHALVEMFFEVTDTSTHKVRFQTSSMASGSKIFGHDDRNYTTFTFIRLGNA
tara:strand:- start:360 stop:914 length:555 start_codon:yes stop_codon:yes gene_type:complete